ncbi:hypothetical protein ACLB2K_072492 [Fragaria x ananassa]
MFTEEAMSRNTIKMVEGLLRDGFVSVGLEIAAEVEETNEVPRVVTDTAVMEYYINATGDRIKDALRVFKHMSASGVEPNSYTYGIIIKALAAADLKKNPNFVGYAKKYFVEMLDRGVQPNEETYEAVLDGIDGENKGEAEEERRVFVGKVKAKGFMLLLQKEAEEMANPSPLMCEMDMLKEHVMNLFEDVIRAFEDKNERKRVRQMAEAEDYDSLSSTAFTFYEALVSRGLNEEAKLFKPLLETAILPDEAVFLIVILLSQTTSDALKVYEHMLAYGITPSSCTYSVLIA